MYEMKSMVTSEEFAALLKRDDDEPTEAVGGARQYSINKRVNYLSSVNDERVNIEDLMREINALRQTIKVLSRIPV